MTEQNQVTPEQVAASTATPVPFNFRNPQPNVIKANQEEGLPAPIKRASVVVPIQMLTKADLIEILTNGDAAAAQLILDQANSVLIDEVRGQLDDLPNYEEVNLELIDFSKVDFVKIANTPKAIRTGGGISDELWEAWANDMQTVLQANSDRNEKQITVVTTLLTKKLKDVSKSEKVLKAVETYLNTWFTATSEENQEKFAVIYARLSARIENYLSSVNEDPLAALGI